VDWEELGRAVLVGFTFVHEVLVRMQTEQAQWSAETRDEPDADEAAAARAAGLLGVSLTATPDEIRAALRAKLATSRLHPDHGGDGELARALIAAQNLLLARARGRS
jgi:hypothetical protein